ncbi:hypothetical protein [Sphingomonas sp.]|uniref:hypothetical protein n=1 Tax=Sphingomonas sp. TaxID=28214 RepID=UPI002C7B68A6|nr:hypothetical protein [Sphingomonas sp.]HTG38937.1 hypothetical protein [Sphingomonas sp.]
MNASTNTPLSGRAILVVEDAYWIAADVGRTLKRAGAHVIGPVPYVEQALAAITRSRVHAAVLDVNLGGVPSFAVARELERHAIPYLLATGYDRRALPGRWQEAIRIDKPFKANELIDVLSRMLCTADQPFVGEEH